MKPLRLLILFEKEWDGSGFGALARGGEIEVHVEGFDLFSFPDNARLLGFDAWRFVDRVCEKYRGRIDGVVSNDEQFGALLAAVIAQRLGLAGNDPLAIVRAQHKLVCREVQALAVPEGAVRSAPLPCTLADRRARDAAEVERMVRSLGLAFPLFVKPVKATFSVLARRVDDAGQLARHLAFGPFERLIIDRLVAPFTAIASRLAALPVDPAGVILEEPVEGLQVNVDGYAFDGEVRVIGVVDELMYPGEAGGAKHFMRFSSPSSLEPRTRARVVDCTERLMRALGFRHGFFNCELFVRADGSVRFIEVNPRLAVQFVSMYRDVDGLDVYRMLVALAVGRDPALVPRLEGGAGAAASFVFRRFDGRGAPAARRAGRSWLATAHPLAELTTYHKRGRSLAREYKWLGSHRYALLNMSAPTPAALQRAYEEACERLGWPAGSAAAAAPAGEPPLAPLRTQAAQLLNPTKMSERSGT
jgi:hypothetical protein